VSLACGNTSNGSGSAGTGGATTSTGKGGAAGASTNTSTSSGGAAASSGGASGSGGAVVASGGASGGPGSGGRSGLDGGAVSGNGGRIAIDAGPGAGGRTGTGGVLGNGGNPGIDGGPVGTGGKGGAGATGTGAGGGTGGMVTTPTVKDPTTAAEGLPKYYISKTGKDTNTGTSPEQAWATVANVPKDKASAVYFEKGGTYSAAGGPAVGRDGPAAFNPVKGSVWTSYGTGDKRPILAATEKTDGKATGGVLSPGGSTLISGISITGKANFGFLIMSDENVIQDCEIDGTIAGSLIQLGISVRGKNNKIVGNYVHSLHEVILDSGSVNTSGGAEAIVVNGSGHEVAYNTIVDCWTENKTLGGAEGGCLEVIARTPGEIVEGINFHHNYCERSVGLFEACAGNFAGTSERIQEHHAVLRNTTLAYNVVVDAMWLYLLQTANTDMDHLTFEHNTLVHGPKNTDIPQQGAAGFGNFYDTDMWVSAGGMTPAPKTCSAAADCGNSFAVCIGGQCAYQFKPQPGQILVRNNLFVVLPGATAATMKLPPGPDDVVNNIFSSKAPQGVTASAGKVIVVSDAGLVDTFRLSPTSPAIDKAASESIKPWVDYDGHAVPCGSGADVGAVEYCP
jgi:hypothetical protein